MLSFAGCNDNCTAPRNDQRRKYAKVEYGEYAEDGMYIAKGMYVAEGRHGEYAKEAASVEEGHNKPLAKEGDDEPLAKEASHHKGNWPRTPCKATTSPSQQ
jgi:hypothetical protein